MNTLNLIDLLLSKLDSPDSKPPTKDEIVALRMRLGLSIREMSKLIGVSKRTWLRYEHGEYEISHSSWLYLLMIANELPGVRVLKIGE